MHLERQAFYDQSKMAAYPSGKGTDCNSVLPGSTPGAASIFFTLGIDSSIIKFGEMNRLMFIIPTMC
jgi:hypothetical protein